MRRSSRTRLVLGAALGLGCLAVVSARGEKSFSDLPEWTEEDASRFEKPGSALLGGGLWPVELQPSPVPAFPNGAEEMVAGEEEEAPKEQAEEATEINVPKIVVRRRDELAKEAEAEVVDPVVVLAGEVPDEHQEAIFGDRPRAFLIDPQHLLSEQKANDVSRFLEYHEGESEIAIYTLILGGRQELPGGVSLAELYGEWFGDEKAVLVAYFLGDPKRVLMEFDAETKALLGERALGEMRQSCIEEAWVEQNPYNQMERFCIELSIRLYWVEKRSEELAGEAAQESKATGKDAVTARNVGVRVDYGLVLMGVVAAALGAAAWLIWWWVRVPNRVFVFPDGEILPRLQAPHSGGGQAVMYFGKRGG